MAKFWPFLAILGVKNFFRPKNFLVSFEVVWRPNFMQKIRKKYQTVKAVGPELTYARTHARTYVREWIYRFLPESKDIRGTNYGSIGRNQTSIRGDGAGGRYITVPDFFSSHLDQHLVMSLRPELKNGTTEQIELYGHLYCHWSISDDSKFVSSEYPRRVVDEISNGDEALGTEVAQTTEVGKVDV